MRVTGYKLTAKSIINENIGKCLLSSLILLFPKVFLVSVVFIFFILYKTEMLHVFFFLPGILCGVAITFFLNSICVPFGELLIFSLVDDSEESEETSDLDMTKEFDLFSMNADAFKQGSEEIQVFDALRSFGFARLLKLRLTLLTNLARDVSLTALPAILLVVLLLTYAAYAPLPIGAFATLCIGSIAILLLAVMELGLEYDKYRYVYLCIPKFADEFMNYSFPYKSMLGESVEKASNGIGAIRRCEVSFWGWLIVSFLLFFLIVPMLYFISYKKLTLYNVITQDNLAYK